MTRICAVLLVTFVGTGIASAQDTVIYYHTDAIGSVRMITDASGGVLERFDYLPFGGNCAPNPPCVAQPPDTKQFTGKDRDTDTSFDYFGARYYDFVSGRFTTPDPVSDIAKAIVEPQLWNRYSYVTNNPFRFLDPDGRQREATLDRDVYALLNKQITVEEYNARIQARGVGGLIGVAPYALPALSTAVEGFIGNLLLRFEIWQATAALGGGITAATLERLAEEGGPTVRVITNQTQALQPGRGFSAAVGEGAEALANAARSGPGVRTFVGNLPKALLDGLIKARLVQTSQTMMNGVTALEYRFLPGSTEYILKFFDELPK